MTVAARQKRETFTYEEYAKLPEGAPYQLIGGELIMTPAASPYHQTVKLELELMLCEFVRKTDLGKVFDAPIDVHLGETDVFQPDILFILKSRLGIVREKEIDGAPDLVVEVLSPTTGYYDLKQKKAAYGAYGVKEYWIVDPIEKSVEVHENTGGDFKLFCRAVTAGEVRSKLLDGFAVQIERLF